MKEIKNVLLCGVGAIGSIYADKISRYNPENLKILVDENRLEKYKNNPKIFNGKELKLNYILPKETNFKADLIIIATKYDGIFDVIKNIENFIKDDTIIISLLNGITSEKLIAQKYGWNHVIHSYFVGHSSMRNGANIVFDGVGYIVFGVLNAGITDKNDEIILKNYFNKIGVDYRVPKDIQYSMWLKYMLNVSSNQVSAILRKTFGQMQKSKKCRKLLENVMREVVEIAKIHGVKNTDNLIKEAFEVFDTMIPDGKTSMLQDIESGRKTEVEMFAGTVIELGEKYNVSTPYNKMLKDLIEITEECM